jgi:CelD/BcsL family acetyltransferase involved in cellulose biosynthesis
VIICRVGDYNAGLIAAASYIDSTWRGLIKLHLANHSRRAVRLQIGLEVARLFLFHTDSATADDHGVTKQNSHFDTPWDEILSRPVDPFPQPGAIPSRFNAARLRNVNEFVKNNVGVMLLATVLAGGAASYRALTAFGSASHVKSDVAHLKATAPESGLVTVTIPAGMLTGSFMVPVDPLAEVRRAQSFVLIRAVDGQTSDARGVIDFDGPGGSPVLHIAVQVPAPNPIDRQYQVSYLLVP